MLESCPPYPAAQMSKSNDQDATSLSPEDSCGIPTETADFVRGALLLQEKWVLLIVHSLMEGSISFGELMRRGNVNTTTLSQRLSLLVSAGILTRTVHATMPPRTSYELTESGLALKPVLEAITQWSGEHLTFQADRGLKVETRVTPPKE